MKNKKRLLILFSIVMALFLLSGCSMPMDENGKIVQITDDTTFQYMMSNEGIFAAIFVYPLAKIINFLVPRTNILVAIAVVAIGVHTLITLLTWKSNIATQKMQLIQPELAKIQKKYEGKDDQVSRMKMSQEMQALYQKNDINPMSSFVTMFIQFPVLIAMYHAVQRSEYVANGTFMGLSLAKTPLQGLQEGNYGYMIIFLLMMLLYIVTMKVPTYLSEKRAKAKAEKQHRRYEKTANPMASSMYFMVIFFGVLLINWPTAMSFYHCITSVVMIVKNIVVDHLVYKESE